MYKYVIRGINMILVDGLYKHGEKVKMVGKCA